LKDFPRRFCNEIFFSLFNSFRASTIFKNHKNLINLLAGMKFANCSISWISAALDLRHRVMRVMRKVTLECRDPTPRAHQLVTGACDSTECVAEKVTHDGRGFLSCFSRTRRNRAIKTRGSNSLRLNGAFTSSHIKHHPSIIKA
jgi:hypothetical protein